MRITKIASLLGAQIVGNADISIEWLLTDSRSLCFAESTLFFAIRTECGDGHLYVKDLYQRGVRAFVVDTPQEGLEEAVQLVVSDTKVALQRLAERHRESFTIPVIGITGSNGKTIVKEWLYQMLSPDMVVTRSPRSYNSQIGVPLSVWGLNANTQIAIFEAGISQPGEMQALQRMIQPTIGVFTGIGPAHQENFQSMEQKKAEKMLLFKDCPVVIEAPEEGDALERNRQVCAQVCRHLGMPEEVIQERLANLEPVAMRLEVKQGRHDNILINDTYNSDLSSLDIALDFMNRRPDRQGRQRVLILSDILQSGVPSVELYAHVARLLEKRGVERFYGIGEQLVQSTSCFAHIAEQCTFFSSTKDFLQSAHFASLRNSMVLIKGARAFHFDAITEALEQKVHETILEVDLSAVVQNLNYYRSFLQPSTRIICMVKADGYGSGAVEIAKTLQSQPQVGYLAVAVADEGALLRAGGITKSIMVMNPEMSSLNTLFEYNLEPEVYSFRILDALISSAERAGITGMPIHIKLDTGMHRLGFDPLKDMPALIERLKHQTALVPRSIFSHFVGSDSDDFDRFSAEQYRRFLHGADILQSAFSHHILRHMCNSAGIEHFPERQMDMVRLGLGLYGINARNNALLSNVGTLKTTILQIHEVPKEETVGYSRRGVLSRDSRIASIPIGYADGWDRLFGNGRAYCLVHGCKAPYVGNICMDVCMIDVTDIPDAQEGDQVILFGNDLSPSILADIVGTIPYEILTSVSSRVKRVYYHE
ncbi:MAG: alanine racemase [Bacteroidaceae bacterium]|nr:alanine racemase [Bacteroidaceae bacterium]